ncbi:MAG: Zn-ribbon domain-containing OB-fold protein [Hyphomonadaceae bacterium]|nr:Zn-ribbon domain-containing OB-fold protein [Hyphomonadaceae bacterium]GIK48803.1 MAG: DNA-binding protein [Alphaproteobacteria bacterium]
MSTVSPPAKPEPVVAPWARPFWDAAAKGQLALQQCEDCSKFIFYPRVACPHCASERIAWRTASGRGTVYSYTVVENNAPSAFIADMPFVVAVIRLEEGVQMLSNIVGCDPDKLRCDMEVVVTFERLNDNFVLPKFRPASNS